MAKTKRPGIYRAILEQIFFSRYEEGMDRVQFKRKDIDTTGIKLGVDPKNLGDLVYSFRFRATMPEKDLSGEALQAGPPEEVTQEDLDAYRATLGADDVD